MRKSKFLSGFLDSANAVSVAIMAAVLIVMTQTSVTDWRSALLAVLSLILVFGFKKINVMWIIIGSAVTRMVAAPCLKNLLHPCFSVEII